VSEVKVLHEWAPKVLEIRQEVARLQDRVKQLEAAVRWRFDDLFGETGNFQMPHELRATLGELFDAWIAAHPIVRSVIEEGEE